MHILHPYRLYAQVKVNQFLSHIFRKIYMKYEVNVFHIKLTVGFFTLLPLIGTEC